MALAARPLSPAAISGPGPPPVPDLPAGLGPGTKRPWLRDSESARDVRVGTRARDFPGPAADSGVEATSLRLGGWARVTRLRDQQRACRGPGNLERSLEMPESHYTTLIMVSMFLRAEWLPFGHTIPNVILGL